MSRNMAGPDGWRVPCFGLCMSPNERDEVRVWAARLDRPVTRAIRELVLAEARRLAALLREAHGDGATAAGMPALVNDLLAEIDSADNRV